MNRLVVGSALALLAGALGYGLWPSKAPDSPQGESSEPAAERQRAERSLAMASLRMPEEPFVRLPRAPRGQMQQPRIRYDRVQVVGEPEALPVGQAAEAVAKLRAMKRPADPRAIEAAREEKELRRAQKRERRRRRDELGDYSKPSYKKRPGPNTVKRQVQRQIDAAESSK